MERMIKAFEIYLIEKVEEKDVVCISPNIQEVNAKFQYVAYSSFCFHFQSNFYIQILFLLKFFA